MPAISESAHRELGAMHFGGKSVESVYFRGFSLSDKRWHKKEQTSEKGIMTKLPPTGRDQRWFFFFSLLWKASAFNLGAALGVVWKWVLKWQVWISIQDWVIIARGLSVLGSSANWFMCRQESTNAVWNYIISSLLMRWTGWECARCLQHLQLCVNLYLKVLNVWVYRGRKKNRNDQINTHHFELGV